MNRKTVKDVVSEYPDGLPEEWRSDKDYIGMGANYIEDLIPYMKGSMVDAGANDCYKICTFEEYDAEIERIAEEDRLFFTGQRIMKDNSQEVYPREFFKDCVDDPDLVKEKTVEDVYDKYKKWPSPISTLCTEYNGEFHFQSHDSFNSFRVVCTYWEYKKYKEEQEEIMKDNVIDWYDYDKQEAISLPPVGVECEWCSHNDGFYTPATILADLGDEDFVIYAEGYKRIVSRPANFRPLDWDKNKQKFVDLDWLDDNCGIDREVSGNGINKWYTVPSNGIVMKKLYAKYIRPRMNHKMVLTDDQLKLIPEGFKYDIKQTCAHNNGVTVRMIYNIVEFTGLQDGYIYPWEK